jgi:hypothetical protein
MQTFVNYTVQSLQDKAIVWLLDSTVSHTQKKDRYGAVEFFWCTSGGSRRVVWSKRGRAVQRREYLHNSRNNTTTLFVDYYPLKPVTA